MVKRLKVKKKSEKSKYEEKKIITKIRHNNSSQKFITKIRYKNSSQKLSQKFVTKSSKYTYHNHQSNTKKSIGKSGKLRKKD